MSLVAYGSSGESDSEEEEQSVISSAKVVPAVRVAEKPQEPEIHISDDEDDITHNNASFIDDYQEPDMMSLIARKLPKSKVDQITQKISSLTDKNEDLSTISKKVDYGTKIEEPPAKKKRTGPVKISIPSLKDLNKIDEDQEEKPVPRVTASKTGSGLFSLLPRPKNTTTRRMINVAKPETGEEEVRRSPVIPPGGQNNLKPSGVRRSGLVPHIISQPKPKAPSPPPSASKVLAAPSVSKSTPVDDSDSEGEDFMGINSGSYFPEDATAKKKELINPTPSGSRSGTTEHIYGLKRPPPPVLPVDNSYVSFNTPEDLGPAVAPYPPPAPTYGEAAPDPLIDNQAAIERLAGKAARRREFADMNIIDVNEADIVGDRNDWLTKALTEEQAPLPNRKNGIKGLEKNKHQITYLAHQAKERDFELRQEWSQARANKRASMNKYGFC